LDFIHLFIEKYSVVKEIEGLNLMNGFHIQPYLGLEKKIAHHGRAMGAVRTGGRRGGPGAAGGP